MQSAGYSDVSPNSVRSWQKEALPNTSGHGLLSSRQRIARAASARVIPASPRRWGASRRSGLAAVKVCGTLATPRASNAVADAEEAQAHGLRDSTTMIPMFAPQSTLCAGSYPPGPAGLRLTFAEVGVEAITFNVNGTRRCAMKLKQFIAKAMFAGGLGLIAVGLGMGTANADPTSPPPVPGAPGVPAVPGVPTAPDAPAMPGVTAVLPGVATAPGVLGVP